MTRRMKWASPRRVLAVASVIGAIVTATALAWWPPRPREITQLMVLRQEPTAGPLRVSTENGRYLVDRNGKSVYLTGSHTWANFQDSGSSEPPPAFDFAAYLDFLTRHNHNFVRLWVWENASGAPWVTSAYHLRPLPFARTGSTLAGDGKPRFDLNRFDEEFFARLRERVAAARDRGIYVSVMLFDGWSIEDKDLRLGNGWPGHPMQRDNNVNDIDGDPNRDGEGKEVHTLAIPAVTAIQERYVRKVIDTIGDLDNVLYEVSNESHAASEPWQYHIINVIKAHENGRFLRHPVGMTVEWPDGSNEDLFAGPADWISPRPAVHDVKYPLPGDARKVVLYDTDHVCGVCADADWVWQSFLRGVSVIFMDPYDGQAVGMGSPKNYDATEPQWGQVRRQMGYALTLANQIDLSRAVPLPERCSSGFCLLIESNTSIEVLAYLPARSVRGIRLPVPRSLEVDVGRKTHVFTVRWLNVETGEMAIMTDVEGRGRIDLKSPFVAPSVLHLRVR